MGNPKQTKPPNTLVPESGLRGAEPSVSDADRTRRIVEHLMLLRARADELSDEELVEAAAEFVVGNRQPLAVVMGFGALTFEVGEIPRDCREMTCQIALPSGLNLEVYQERGTSAQLHMELLELGLVWLDDLLAYRQLQRQLQEANERLARSQAQAIHSEKLATLGKMAAGLLHEVNNPITSLIAYTDALETHAATQLADETAAKYLQRIRESAHRVQRYSREVITYARPAKDLDTLVYADAIVNQSLRFCEHVIANNNVAIIRSFSDDLPPVPGSAAELAQVFVNLITNACHACPQEDAELRIGIYRVHHSVVVEIADNGPGIAVEDAAQVFEPFYSTKPQSKGTGLGLAIAKEIVANHGGQISVQPASTGGACFVIELPWRRREPHSAGLPRSFTACADGVALPQIERTTAPASSWVCRG